MRCNDITISRVIKKYVRDAMTSRVIKKYARDAMTLQYHV